jgi:hypothetical protein
MSALYLRLVNLGAANMPTPAPVLVLLERPVRQLSCREAAARGATRRSLIDAHADEFLGFAFSSETHRSINTFKAGNECRDIPGYLSYSTCDPGKYFS